MSSGCSRGQPPPRENGCHDVRDKRWHRIARAVVGMKVLVCPAMMEIGGSQTNAVELAEGVASLGNEVEVFGPNGPLVDLVRDMGMTYHYAPVEESWPCRSRMSEL